MIASFRIANVHPSAALRVLRRSPAPARVPGQRFAATMLTGPLDGATRG
jgi:hypothetical protein